MLALFNFGHELKPDQLLLSNLLKAKFSFILILKILSYTQDRSYTNCLNNWNIYM